MKASIIRNNHKAIYLTIATVFWAAVWYIAALVLGNELFLPYPHTVLKALGALLCEKNYWISILNTVLTVVTGCLLGCLAGAVLSILSALSKLMETVISPLIAVFRATPVASFIILVYVIVRLNQLPVRTVSLLIVMIMVIPIMYNNLRTGISVMDRELAEVSIVYRFSFGKKLLVLWLPQIKPYLLSSLTNALGFAWKAGVAAEVICNLKDTVGKHLADSKSNLEMDKLFAWTFTVILFSMLFELVFKKAFKKGDKQQLKEEVVS